MLTKPALVLTRMTVHRLKKIFFPVGLSCSLFASLAATPRGPQKQTDESNSLELHREFQVIQSVSELAQRIDQGFSFPIMHTKSEFSVEVPCHSLEINGFFEYSGDLSKNQFLLIQELKDKLQLYLEEIEEACEFQVLYPEFCEIPEGGRAPKGEGSEGEKTSSSILSRAMVSVKVTGLNYLSTVLEALAKIGVKSVAFKNFKPESPEGLIQAAQQKAIEGILLQSEEQAKLYGGDSRVIVWMNLEKPITLTPKPWAQQLPIWNQKNHEDSEEGNSDRLEVPQPQDQSEVLQTAFDHLVIRQVQPISVAFFPKS